MPYAIEGSDREKIRMVIRALEENGKMPFRNTILASLKNVLRNVIGVSIEVDEWPSFTSIISCLHMPVLVDGDENASPTFQCYSTNPERLTDLLSKSRLLPWDKEWIVCALPVSLEPIWRKEAQARGGRFDREDGTTYIMLALRPDSVKSTNIQPANLTLPKGYTLGTLRPEHAELVSSCWKFGGTKRMTARIRYMIERLPSMGVFNERGEAVSWALTALDGSGGIGYTLPEYRRHGIYKVTVSAQVVTQRQAGLMGIGYTVEENTAARRATPAQPWPEHVVYGEYTPPTAKL